MVALVVVAAVFTQRVKPIRQILAPTCACYVIVRKWDECILCQLGANQRECQGWITMRCSLRCIHVVAPQAL